MSCEYDVLEAVKPERLAELVAAARLQGWQTFGERGVYFYPDKWRDGRLVYRGRPRYLQAVRRGGPSGV